MSVNRTIPTRDFDFNVWQANIAQTALDNREKWLLDAEWLDKMFVPARDAWNNAWEAYKNPATRTIVINAAKKQKRADYEKLLYLLVGNLKMNTRVTSEDRHAAGIVMRNRKPAPIGVPTTYPFATIDTSIIRRLTVRFRDSDSMSLAKPRGVHGAEIRWMIAEEMPATNELANSSFDTRTPCMFEFKDSQRGKLVWFCLRWENNRGEKGPWGEMISAIVP